MVLKKGGYEIMTLFQDMENKAPDRNPVFTAIEELKTPDEIRQFVKEYEDYLVANSNEETKGRERQVARSNVGYILGYYSDETQKRWYKELPNVSHPVFGYGFGRGQEITPEEAFEKGKEIGANITKRKKVV
jgi:hypothetical protein